MSNTVTIVGNLVADPESKTTSSGVSMANIRLAVSAATRRAGSGPKTRPTSQGRSGGTKPTRSPNLSTRGIE